MAAGIREDLRRFFYDAKKNVMPTKETARSFRRASHKSETLL
jgi:hypothetical protein